MYNNPHAIHNTVVTLSLFSLKENPNFFPGLITWPNLVSLLNYE